MVILDIVGKNNVFDTKFTKYPPFQMRRSWSLAWKFPPFLVNWKTRVFQPDPPQTIPALTQRIVDDIAAVPENILKQGIRIL